jgi:hypothetical protein
MGSLRIVFGVLMKTAFVLGMAFELLGCAGPAAVTVAGVAVDSASYAASGKSFSDHAMSAVSGDDCRALGVLKNGVLCRSRVAEPEVQVENVPPPFAEPPAHESAATVDNSEATFLVLGVFPDWENADHTVVMGRFYNPLIVPLDSNPTDDAKAASGPAYWVIAGHPLVGGDGKLPVTQAKGIGFDGARTVSLCRATYRPAPCETEDNTVTVAATRSIVAAKVVAARRPGVTVAQRIDR